MPADRDRSSASTRLQIHAGQRVDRTTGARAMPIYQTTSYVFEDTQHAADLFDLNRFGNTYTRIVNPTTAAFEERVASLEGGVGALATASGLGRRRDRDADPVEAGDEIVSAQNLYGGTHNQLAIAFPRFGITTRFVDPHDLDAVAAAIGPSAPAAVRRDDRQPAHRRARHRRLGADRRRARAAADDRQHLRDALPVPPVRARRAHRDPLRDEVHRRPRHVHRRRHRRRRHVRLGRRALPRPHGAVGGLPRHALRRDVRQLRVHHEGARRDDARPRAGAVARSTPSCSCRGWRRCACAWTATAPTPARSRRSCARTRASPGCRTPTSPTRRTPRTRARYLPQGPGRDHGLRHRGRPRGGRALHRGAASCCSHLANVGDAKTLVIHPGSTTHRRLDEEALAAAASAPDMIRLSVGLEDLDDLIWDIDQALERSA